MYIYTYIYVYTYIYSHLHSFPCLLILLHLYCFSFIVQINKYMKYIFLRFQKKWNENYKHMKTQRSKPKCTECVRPAPRGSSATLTEREWRNATSCQRGLNSDSNTNQYKVAAPRVPLSKRDVAKWTEAFWRWRCRWSSACDELQKQNNRDNDACSPAPHGDISGSARSASAEMQSRPPRGFFLLHTVF